MDSIIMCSHGTTGFMRWTLGSVAQKVVRHSTVPVLLLREGEATNSLLQPQDIPHPLRVMVALDGSALAETALLPAASLCSALSTPAQGEIKLTLVLTGVENEQQRRIEETKNKEHSAEAYLETVKQRCQEDLARFQVQMTATVVLGVDAADMLIKVSENNDDEEIGLGSDACDMIAMATHGRDAAIPLTMGSVTERVMEATRLPLLIM